jgi:hypothetical protein
MAVIRIDELVPIEPSPDLRQEMEKRGLVGYFLAHPVGGQWFPVLKSRDGLYVRAGEVISVMDGAARTHRREAPRRGRLRRNPRRSHIPQSIPRAMVGDGPKLPIRFGDLLNKQTRHAWIGKKIEQLRKERYPEEQSIAIAYSELRKAMKGAGRKVPTDLHRKRKIPAGVKRNPRSTKQERLQHAIKLYSGFREERPDRVGEHELPADDTGVVMGDCIGIVYQTTIDGKREKFMHQFTARAAPMLAASWDGQHLYLLGGRYRVGPRGIVDQRG